MNLWNIKFRNYICDWCNLWNFGNYLNIAITFELLDLSINVVVYEISNSIVCLSRFWNYANCLSTLISRFLPWIRHFRPETLNFKIFALMGHLRPKQATFRIFSLNGIFLDLNTSILCFRPKWDFRPKKSSFNLKPMTTGKSNLCCIFLFFQNQKKSRSLP